VKSAQNKQDAVKKGKVSQSELNKMQGKAAKTNDKSSGMGSSGRNTGVKRGI
jgi:hypothetical protein